VVDQTSQDTGRLKQFIEFCNLNFADSYNLGGSLCDYFFIKDFKLKDVNDYDVILDRNEIGLDYLENLRAVREFKYRGDLRYIGEESNAQQVFKSKVKINSEIYTVDWILGHTIKLPHDVIDIEFQGLKTKLTSKKLRTAILKNIASNKFQQKFFQNKGKKKLSSYIDKTIL